MTNKLARARPPSAAPRILAGWEPASVLWEGSNAPYPSSESARWDLRQLRPALVAAGALAYDRGRLKIHPERFAAVKDQAAVDAARRRLKEAA